MEEIGSCYWKKKRQIVNQLPTFFSFLFLLFERLGFFLQVKSNLFLFLFFSLFFLLFFLLFSLLSSLFSLLFSLFSLLFSLLFSPFSFYGCFLFSPSFFFPFSPLFSSSLPFLFFPFLANFLTLPLLSPPPPLCYPMQVLYFFLVNGNIFQVPITPISLVGI